MITRETDYAIRALLYLAQHADRGIISTTVLADSMDIPYRFLRRILLQLADTGLVTSFRGKYGGLKLSRDPSTVSLLDIVRAVDPHVITLNLCLSEPLACVRTPHCVVHEELARVQDMLDRELGAITLAMLVERIRACSSHTLTV